MTIFLQKYISHSSLIHLNSIPTNNGPRLYPNIEMDEKLRNNTVLFDSILLFAMIVDEIG